MGFKIGKFFGRIGVGVLKSVPAAIAGFAAGGPAGASLALLSGTTFGGGGGGPAPAGTNASFNTTSSFLPYGMSRGGGLPSMQPEAFPVANVPAIITKDIFDLIIRLATRLGITIKRPGAVVGIGRSIIAKLLRFARATPGLTIVSMLTTLGLTLIEANSLLTWYTTRGKRRRRIKVTNVKALNRSVRRLEGFRRLSHRVELALAHRGLGRARSRSRRCPKCRKSPCCC